MFSVLNRTDADFSHSTLGIGHYVFTQPFNWLSNVQGPKSTSLTWLAVFKNTVAFKILCAIIYINTADFEFYSSLGAGRCIFREIPFNFQAAFQHTPQNYHHFTYARTNCSLLHERRGALKPHLKNFTSVSDVCISLQKESLSELPL